MTKQLQKCAGHLCCAVLLSGAVSVTQANDITSVPLSDVPLFIAAAADPNIMFVLDDSGSMQWSYIPDSLFGWCWDTASVTQRARGRSSDFNEMYYDPEASYPAPMKGDGTQLPDASFSSAWTDGYAEEGSVNLATNYRATWHYSFHGNRAYCGAAGAADYYVYDETCGDKNNTACYSRTIVSDTSGPNNTDERQNFANWYSYYRNRMFASRAGITAAFVDLPESMRIGYGSINTTGTVERGVRPFLDEDEGESYRSDFFTWLQSTSGAGLTPLRRALYQAGQYFEDKDEPWRNDPAAENEDEVSDFAECRQSFTILMTDGYWNRNSQGVGNVDNKEGEVITGPGNQSFQYKPAGPFSDDHSDTLADIAMHFWNRDLQPDIVNRVPSTQRNPAFWQHMVTYGVGLGVEGTENADEAFKKMVNGGDIAWPDPDTTNDADPAKIDDLLHAAVNSRGGFFSASDPDTFATELSGVLGDIAEAVGSSTGVTFDTATLEQDSLIFAARFDSARWSGDLDARPLLVDEDDDTALPEIGEPVWSAAQRLDSTTLDLNARSIITSDGTKGIPFRWSDDLTDEQATDLRFGGGTEAEQLARAESRVAYLRGDRSNEGGADGFRVRDSRLGDIVNSTPVRVARPGSGWPDSEPFGADEDRYSDFRGGAAGNRTPVIYTGANDGMLHGFRATDDGGDEMLAFMPSAIFSSQPQRGLHHLTSTGYSHRYYVDLPPLVSDAYIQGRRADGTVDTSTEWRTVLLGGSRFGAKGIFALDVTDPDRFDEANAGELLLWEFTAADDDRLGYITEPPIIALAEWDDGDEYWTAFVSNGYNSEQESTGFFMIKLEGGLNGGWTEASGNNTNDYKYVEFLAGGSGLSPLSLYDDTGDGIVNRVYAGDLNGNIWVAALTNQGWRSAYRGGGQVPRPFFTAREGDATTDTSQPITAAPLIIRHDGNRHVVFGTGQYLNSDDLGSTQQQSLYSVREAGGQELSRTNLARRNLREVADYEGSGVDVLLSDAIEGVTSPTGWYVDLVDVGERITLSPQARGNFLFVNSSIPSDNPCVAGGASRIMAFSLDGLTPDRAVFTAFDGEVVSYKLEDGIASQSAFLGNFRFTPTSIGTVSVEEVDTGEPLGGLGRQGWQELIE